MSNRTRGRGVKLKPRPQQNVEEVVNEKDASPPGDIYESVARDFGFDPLKEMAARRT